MSAITEALITGGVLIGIFLLAYSSIRHKDLMEVVVEIRDILSGNIEKVKEKAGELRYAN